MLKKFKLMEERNRVRKNFLSVMKFIRKFCTWMIILSFFGILATIFAWIWYSFELAAKIGFSSFIVFVVFRFTLSVAKNVESRIDEIVNEEYGEPEPRKTFEERVQEKMEEAKIKNHGSNTD